ncbi:aldo/keto reductase [Candidatus Latescibacterota bacterium]
MGNTTRRAFIKMSSTAAGLGITAGCSSIKKTSSESNIKTVNGVRYRKLGSTGFDVSEVGFGAMNMRDPELVHAAIDMGINYIDTAHGYMNGVNEEVVGQVMKTKRDKVFLVTKVHNSEDANLRKMMELSLKRLQTDHVDTMTLHMPRGRNEALDENCIKIFEQAKKDGLCRFVGVSTHSNHEEVIKAAIDSKFWQSVLVGYNYTSPQSVTDAIKEARNAGLAVIGMKTMARGKGYADHNMGDITPVQAALKWVLNNPNIDTTIPGVTTFEHIGENFKVMSMSLSFDNRPEPYRYSEANVNNYCCGVAGCSECDGQCQKGVNVSELNRCLGYVYGYNDMKLARENFKEFSLSSMLDKCKDCGECTVKCVNSLNLAENITRAKILFG